MLEAFIFGFLGSFHCIGMCGPIAMSLPVKSDTPVMRGAYVLLYNFGRIVTYAFIGLFFGLIGMGFKLAGIQQGLSIALGVLIFIIALAPYLHINKFSANALLNKPLSFLRTSIASLFNQHKWWSLFTIGLLNGLLPCGFVYLGIIWTTSLGDIYQGALFMIFFGLGTVPAMMSMGMLSSLFNLKVRNRIKKAMPALMMLMGLLLIIRGLNLGIPYLSPYLQNLQSKNPVECHSPESKN